MKLTKILKRPRVIILLFFLILSLYLISPQFNTEGVAVRSVDASSPAYFAGLTSPPTEASPTSYEKITEINSQRISNIEDYNRITENIQLTETITVKTNKDSYVFEKLEDNLGITVSNYPDSNIRKGLDLQGGTRVLLQPVEKLTTNQLDEVIAVMDTRLNTYGLSDVQIRPTSDLDGNNFILVEIAGATQEEVENIIASQGNFEAKIGEEVVFTGGTKDVTYVCRNDGTCSGITQCGQLQDGSYVCNFEFQISLSKDAAVKHKEVTNNLEVITSESGNRILSEQIDFFLDENLVDSLNIAEGLKGIEASEILISGSEIGITEEDAFEAAEKEMNRLQTVLLTGSLPYELEVVQLDSISPTLGLEFLKTAIVSGLAAILAVALVIFIRFRTWKIALPVLITMISEVILILGFAALFKQNLDLAGIVGIIAAVGTGVDDQIIITDETLGKNKVEGSWKTRLKHAFFIILAAYFTTIAAMLPLFRAGAGLIRGFAFVTIVGVTIGVLIARPAFAAIIEILNEE